VRPDLGDKGKKDGPKPMDARKLKKQIMDGTQLIASLLVDERWVASDEEAGAVAEHAAYVVPQALEQLQKFAPVATAINKIDEWKHVIGLGFAVAGYILARVNTGKEQAHEQPGLRVVRGGAAGSASGEESGLGRAGSVLASNRTVGAANAADGAYRSDSGRQPGQGAGIFAASGLAGESAKSGADRSLAPATPIPAELTALVLS